MKLEPLKGKRFEEAGYIEGYIKHPQGNLLKVEDVKAAVKLLKKQLGYLWSESVIPMLPQSFEKIIETIDTCFEDVK